MAVELVRDLLKIDQTIGKEQIQALVEGEILLPDPKPEIDKILNIDGNTEVTETKVMKDKIIVDGIVNFKVLYNAKKDENQPIHSIEATTDFSEEIEIAGAKEQMAGDVKTTIEHIDYNVLEGDKIAVKTVLLIDGKVQTDNNVDIVKDITGEGGLQVLKESIMYNNVVGTNNSTTIVKEAFEIGEDLPDIVDILRVDAKAYEKETKAVDDKVIVAGIVEASIMYFGDDEDNKINYLNHEIPFTHFVEISGAVKDMSCISRIYSGNPTYEAKEDINGNLRIIDFESIVNIYAKVYEQKEKEVTVDTYSTDKKFNVDKQEVNITENIGDAVTKEVITEVIDVSNDNEIIKDIYNVNAKPILTDYRTVEDKIIIEGLVEVSMLYFGEESGEIKDVAKEIPFKSYAELETAKGEMESEVEIILENLSFNKINSREVEVEVTIKNQVEVNRVKKISIVTGAKELEEDLDKKSRPSITIYIAQQDDTLWDIAKRYNTTTDELIKTNEIMTPDNIMPGEKIIIEKKVNLKI